MSDFVKKCILAHMKRMALLVFGIVVPISLLIMLIGMIAAVLPVHEMLVVALCGCGAGILIFASTLFQTIRFVHMIRHQEQLYGSSFSNEQFMPTHPKASRLNQHYHFSDNWYMCEGSWALHRLYIVKVTQKVSGARVGLQYHALVETVVGKTYKLRMESASDLKRFYTWYKDAGK